MNEWFEDLPEDCPPSEAIPPDGDSNYYRLVSSVPPSEDDFVPMARLKAERTFRGRRLCQALAISVVDSLEASHELLKLPTQKDKNIVEMKLTPEAGAILQTGSRSAHHSWWRARAFDAPGAAQAVA